VSTPDSKEHAALSRWLRCVSRGRHDFDEFGLCLECGAERDGPTVADVVQSEANRRARRTT
jgi:hypothetical protein